MALFYAIWQLIRTLELNNCVINSIAQGKQKPIKSACKCVDDFKISVDSFFFPEIKCPLYLLSVLVGCFSHGNRKNRGVSSSIKMNKCDSADKCT